MTGLDLNDYELIDSGDGRRLERVAGLVIDRPAPQAFWSRNTEISEWKNPTAFYERSESGPGKWRDLSVFPKDWHIKIGNISLALKPSANNQLGVFPEQCDNWQWITKKIRNAGRPLRILNAFAYTGAATLMSSAAARDVEVCHVDGAKTSVTWAKQNALLSGLESKSIRWIVDDVLKFLAREIKRGRTYDAFILDPPAFGRGAKTEWSLERDLPLLLDCVDQLLSPHPCFVVLSCHAPHMIATDLAHQLEKLPAFAGKQAQTLNLTIASKQGHALPLGICARI